MDDTVTSKLGEYNALRSILDSLIQSELDPSTYQGNQTPDETPSTPRSDALADVLDPSTTRCHAPNVLDEREPQNIADKDHNEPISRRRGARCAPSPIIIPQTAMPPPLPQARERALGRRSSESVQAGPTHRTSSLTIKRVLPTCTTDHPPVANHSEVQRSKRRRLGTASQSKPSQPEPSQPEPSQPGPTHEGENTPAVDTVPPDIFSKISHIGSVEVLEELRGNIFRLRAGARRMPLPRTTRRLEHSSLRNELEDTEMGEQICRFHKRIALSCFYDFYEMAKEHPSCLLAQDPSTMEGTNRLSADDSIRKQAPRLASVVLNRIVDLMFPNTVLTSKDAITTSKDAVTASDEIRRALKDQDRKAAV